MFFFFQAEDGIRDGHVTGVQTCALPIFTHGSHLRREPVQLDETLCVGLVEGVTGVISREEIGRASCRERVEISVVGGASEEKEEATGKRKKKKRRKKSVIDSVSKPQCNR